MPTIRWRGVFGPPFSKGGLNGWHTYIHGLAIRGTKGSMLFVRKATFHLN
jgi:hypothetical protein